VELTPVACPIGSSRQSPLADGRNSKITKAGNMKSNHKTLTDGQQVALPEILSLLGLQYARLSSKEQMSLCERLHSVPYKDRSDAGVLHERLKLALMCVEAMSRDESKNAISKDGGLVEMLQRLKVAVQTLHRLDGGKHAEG